MTPERNLRDVPETEPERPVHELLGFTRLLYEQTYPTVAEIDRELGERQRS